MVFVPFNDTFKKQQGKLVRATFKKAFIVAVNASACTANVFFAESPQNVIKNVPLAAHIIPALVNAGDRCRIDLFDETNPNDMVVAYIYGRTSAYQQQVRFATGTLSLNMITGSGSIAHGLGVAPDVVGVFPFIGLAGYVGVDYPFVSSWDDTSINWSSSTTNAFVSANWFALKF
jgi:hypothetical protein